MRQPQEAYFQRRYDTIIEHRDKAARDDVALEHFLQRARRNVVAGARLFLSQPHQREDLEDAVSNCLLHIIESVRKQRGMKLMSIDSAEGLEVYLKRAGSNSAIDIFRKKTKELPAEQLVQALSQQRDFRNIVIQRIHLMRALNVLKRTNPRHFRVFEMRYYQQLEYEEIAGVLNISQDTARALYSRALKHLKRIVRE